MRYRIHLLRFSSRWLRAQNNNLWLLTVAERVTVFSRGLIDGIHPIAGRLDGQRDKYRDPAEGRPARLAPLVETVGGNVIALLHACISTGNPVGFYHLPSVVTNRGLTVPTATIDMFLCSPYHGGNSALCPYGCTAEGAVVSAEAVYVGPLTADVGNAPVKRSPRTVGIQVECLVMKWDTHVSHFYFCA